MLNSLDWLVIVFMGLAALTLLSLCLMFLLKNKKGKRVCLYIVAVLGAYVSTIGLRIGFVGGFTGQIAVGVVTLIVSVGAAVLDIVSRQDERKEKLARILAAVGLIVGFVNALLI